MKHNTSLIIVTSTNKWMHETQTLVCKKFIREKRDVDKKLPCSVIVVVKVLWAHRRPG